MVEGVSKRAPKERPQHQPKPPWLKVSLPGGTTYAEIQKRVRGASLNTVCMEARCPNVGECWSQGTATLMLLGDTCTRGCRFCSVGSGKPALPDEREPEKVVETVMAMGLDYVVLTMVDRDDLPDGGAAHVATTVKALKQALPELVVELLTGDFQGKMDHLKVIVDSDAQVLGHNLETVSELTHLVRDPRCGYEQSLAVLSTYKELAPERLTKSSLMLGLGETREQVHEAMADLREHRVDILTLGQYLQPSRAHLPVVEYVEPGEFEELAQKARALGFTQVAAGPLVRSSYRAAELATKEVLLANQGSSQ